MDMTYLLKGADANSVNLWFPFVSEYLAQWVPIEATIPRITLDLDYQQ
jgi:hypothetical protein